MDLAPDFDEFIGCVIARGVEFVIVGAYALAYHGAPHTYRISERPAGRKISPISMDSDRVTIHRHRVESRQERP